MSMVKISNGEVTQIVSKGAYDCQYKKLGFEIVRDNSLDVVSVDKNVNNVDGYDVVESLGGFDDDRNEFEELLEKPLSQWSNDELKEFVNAKGIDTASAKKTSEVRSLVKRYLDNEAKKAAEV